MFSPLHGFLEREQMGMFAVNTALASGLAVDIDTTNTAPLTGSIYGPVYANVVTATLTTASNNLREIGWLMQPVTASGPSLLNVLTQIYDESVKQGSVAVVVMPKAGALIATDQFLATGTGKIAFDGTVAPGTVCGIAAGQPRVLQAGDQPRLKFLGKVVQRAAACASFQLF